MMSGGNNVPEPLVNIKEFLPTGLMPEQNGIIPVNLLTKIHCGGQLCIDAARAWNAMVRAAFLDGIYLNLSHPLNAYKNLVQQRRLFLTRFAVVDPDSDAESDPKTIRVEFDNKIYELQRGKEYVECPGQISHGFGLAVFIVNATQSKVRAWLDQNANQFGFVREYNFIPGRFIYIKSREPVPERVVEIENMPPEPKYSATLIAKRTGAKWLKTPSDDWSCVGMFTGETYRSNALAVVKQSGDIGIDEKSLGTFYRQFAGLICTNPTGAITKLNCPTLVTTDLNDTIEKLTALFNEDVTSVETAVENVEELLRADVDFYKKVLPEAQIFKRKKKIAQRLLDIPVDDLKTAPDQFWYNEYHALLQIRLENPALINLGNEYCDELMKWYKAHSKSAERELAILGIIQFLDPTKLTVPFNEHLWHKDMIADVRGAFLNYFTRPGFSDDEISTYWLARQQTWRHPKRKIRVVFLIDSNGQSDKMMLVYPKMRERDDFETSICLYAARDYKLNDKWCNWFRETYPNDPIYDFNGLFDLRKLKPDYVFIQGPYEFRRRQPGLSSNDLVKFTKVIHLSYGVTLAHIFIDRLIDSQANFYRNLYMMFCSGESVRKKMIARFAQNVSAGYQHMEFCGYTALAKTPLPQDDHSKKTILWTPRWSYEPRIGGSHFLEYKDNFVELRDRYGDKVNLAMRPHGNTFRDLQEKNLITKEEVDAYKQTVSDKDIKIYETSFDLYEQFRLTDILIGDYSSILPVYFITGRPLIYCEYPNAVMLDEYKEMYECMYVARSWDDVLKYLDDLVAGNDPLFERRQAAAEKIRADHADAAQRIIDRIVEDFKRCTIDEAR